ncbi:MAG: CGNR zinc finger domain-containing protein [Bdellovibrionales bacterium]|nr:CGNR zinc finger domain-containing protein [Bdellovibrionales bacterium]
MEKVLQNCFYVQNTDKNGNTGGKPPIRYDRRFTTYLTEGANNHIKQLKDRDQIQIAHDDFIYWCMNEYLKNGASTVLVNTLNKNICIIGHQCHVMNSAKKMAAMFVAHIPHKPPPTVFAAYMFSNMVSLGWLEGLKRCKNPECQQFFIGRSNVKWCSTSCGSLYRVRQKRKRDKQ